METTLPISNRGTYYRELVTQVTEELRIHIEDNEVTQGLAINRNVGALLKERQYTIT